MSQPLFQHYPDAGTALMPLPHSYDAPYYSGQVSDPIEDFLNEYEELANGCNLTEQQKVEKITRYIHPELRYLWKSLNGYRAHNWANFRLELEAIYEGPSVPSRLRHAKQRLVDFVRHSSKSRINDEGDVLNYYRQFLLLSNPLLNAQQLSTSECNKAFWCGFHSQDRVEMHARLIAKHPEQPSGVHFDYRDIYKVAKVTFSGNHRLDMQLDNLRNKSQGYRSNRLESAQYQRSNQEEHSVTSLQKADPVHKMYEQCRYPIPIDCRPRGPRFRHSDARLTPPPKVEIVASPLRTHMPPPPPARQSQPVAANFLRNHDSCVPSAHVEDSDLDREDPFSRVFAAEKELEARRSHLPKFRPSAPVFTTATPSASIPIVSPTSVPAAPAMPTPVVTPIPASPEIAADCATPVVPPVPVAVAPAIPTVASIVSSASVVPAAATPIVSPAPSAVNPATITPTPSATAAAAPPIPIVDPMPIQIMPAHTSDPSPATQKSIIENVEVLHVEATSVEEAASIIVTNAADQHTQSPSAHEPAYSLPLHEIDITISGVLSCPQRQRQHCHDRHSCFSHSEPEMNGRATYPSQQRPPVTVVPPPVLKYPDKRSGSPTNKSLHLTLLHREQDLTMSSKLNVHPTKVLLATMKGV